MTRRIAQNAFSAIAFLAALGASSAQAQNCNIPPPSLPFLNLGTLAGSPAAISGMITSSIFAVNSAFLTQTGAFVAAPGNPAPGQEGGGVWVRGVGGEARQKSSTVSTSSSSVPPASTSLNCSQNVQTTFAGVQFGTDIARLNLSGWNIHVGTTAGYVGTSSSLREGTLSFIDGFTGLPAGGGPFSSKTDAPFAGAYVVATREGFSIDAMLRAQSFQTSLNAPGTNLFNQGIDAHGFLFSSSASYFWKIPNSNWFIEPSAGVVISRTKVDPFNFVSAGSTNLLVDTRVSGTLQLDEIKSDIARVGVRVGTQIDGGNILWQPFASVSVWHDFAGNTTSRYSTCPGCFAFFPLAGAPVASSLSVSSSTTNVGTYGQYSLGLSGAVAGTGFLGFVRVDYRDGSQLQSLSGTGGIRYQFTPEVAVAKMPLKAPASLLQHTVNWNGFYIGAFGGADIGRGNWDYFTGTSSPHIGGFDGGGNIGYDWQFDRWVLGVEAAIGAGNVHGETACGPNFGIPGAGPNGFPFNAVGPMFQVTCGASYSWLATATGRAGYTFGRALFYVKGGAAWADERFVASCNTSQIPPLLLPCAGPNGANLTTRVGATNGFTAGTTKTGWTLGFGTDFALSKNWFARGETNYIDFGDSRLTGSDGTLFSAGSHVWQTKIGLNYRFSSEQAAVVAKY